MSTLKVSIIGASGYSGGELLRILLQHPQVHVHQVTSNRYAGLSVTQAHPNLRSITSLKFTKIEHLESCDFLFTSLPNGESMHQMSAWMQLAEKIIDLGADFRLNSQELWQKWYGTKHCAPHNMAQFTYGVPELFREQIQKSQYVSGPGCEAIVSILSLFPFVKQAIIKKDQIIIDAKMGSSQAGNRPSPASHHPERAGVTRSYKPTGHRHTAEIEHALGSFCSGTRVDITATAIEMVRGILVTIHTSLENPIEDKEIWNALRKEYSQEPFIRIVKEKRGLYRFPEPKILQGTNHCEIGFEKDGRNDRLVIIGAIDNLVKGTAGNATQCMNLMCGFPETQGLEFPGLHPV